MSTNPYNSQNQRPTLSSSFIPTISRQAKGKPKARQQQPSASHSFSFDTPSSPTVSKVENQSQQSFSNRSYGPNDHKQLPTMSNPFSFGGTSSNSSSQNQLPAWNSSFNFGNPSQQSTPDHSPNTNNQSQQSFSNRSYAPSDHKQQPTMSNPFNFGGTSSKSNSQNQLSAWNSSFNFSNPSHQATPDHSFNFSNKNQQPYFNFDLESKTPAKPLALQNKSTDVKRVSALFNSTLDMTENSNYEVDLLLDQFSRMNIKKTFVIDKEVSRHSYAVGNNFSHLGICRLGMGFALCLRNDGDFVLLNCDTKSSFDELLSAGILELMDILARKGKPPEFSFHIVAIDHEQIKAYVNQLAEIYPLKTVIFIKDENCDVVADAEYLHYDIGIAV